MSYGVSDMSDSELEKDDRRERERDKLCLMKIWSFVLFIASFIGGSYLLSFFSCILWVFIL